MSDNLRDHLGLFEMADQDRSWIKNAACKGSKANFFPKMMGESGVREAVAVCHSCPVAVRCVQYAINNNIKHGVWGGFTARGRRELAKAMEYIENENRIEHRTTSWFNIYTKIKDPDPVGRTAQTLGISRATVYHHMRIDRLAKETVSIYVKPK